MTQYERRAQRAKPNRRLGPKPWLKFNITKTAYRAAYMRWHAAKQRGNKVPIDLFIESPRVKLVRAKPRAYYYAKRALQLALATPKWVDFEAICNFYANRPDGFEVDHIVAINSKLVCGLHVPWNLQYLPIDDHRAKTRRDGSK